MTFTGYSLSNQYILLPINPEYEEGFYQSYEDLHKLFWNSKLAKLVFWISEQLPNFLVQEAEMLW